MFLWFIAVTFAAVVLVFDSPALDLRVVVVGALVPWLDVLWGPQWVLHSVLAPVVVMVAVMVLGWGRRLWQRRWLGIPIGMFVHLILDATWTIREVFWWPVFGSAGDAYSPLGVQARLALEVCGIGVGVWIWRRFGFGTEAIRNRFARTGRVDPRSAHG